jgi:hypothetical protein
LALTAWQGMARQIKPSILFEMKYWEIIARNLKKRGWSLGYVSAIDSNGRAHHFREFSAG